MCTTPTYARAARVGSFRKPHIFKKDGVWTCVNCRGWAEGFTPSDAYSVWSTSKPSKPSLMFPIDIRRP